MTGANPDNEFPARANGWTAQRRHKFFASIAAGETVARACSRVGLSREAAYKARRRDADFAGQWKQAQDAALLAAEQTFLDKLPSSLRARALDNPQGEPEALGFLPQDTVNSVTTLSTCEGPSAAGARGK